jgi:hypothetical protein
MPPAITSMVGLLALILATGVGARFLTDEYHLRVALGVLCIGVLFDLLSLFYAYLTWKTGKFMSGVPVLGLLLYVWFLLAARFTLTGGLRAWDPPLYYKGLDFLILFAFHVLCQWPGFRLAKKHVSEREPSANVAPGPR